MSMKAFDVAYYWSPREAAAILDYLDRLRDLVWDLYGEKIIELRRAEDEHGKEPIDDKEGNTLSESQQRFVFDSDINN